MSKFSAIILLVTVLFSSRPSWSIETKKNLDFGMESKNKIIGGPTAALLHGQYAVNVLKVLNLDLGAAIIKPLNGYRYNYQYGFSFYPLRAVLPDTARYLPYLGMGKFHEQAGLGTLYKLGLEILAKEKQGLAMSIQRQVVSAQNSTQYLLGLFWRK